ncbi:hypothetical protein BKA82DRAFT_4355023 [Pisolithus tinctorius]|nr:hypothetical protein BKA82DRAFT_4355023 [Pisolithus tinctorius]
MAHQNYVSDGVAGPNKLSSRLASLRMFKPKSGSGSGSTDSSLFSPPPPPKDNAYSTSSNSPSNAPSAFNPSSHHKRVDERYTGLPPSWTTALSTAGFDEEEIAAIHARRKAATAAVNVKNGSNAPSPHTQYSSARPASPTPPPTLTIGTGSGLTSATGSNRTPSPRTTGFGVRTLIPNGFLGSRGGDSASTASGNRSRSGSVNRADLGLGSSQSHLSWWTGAVDAAGGIEDESLIEQFPYDTTPRGPQVQRSQSETGNVPFPSPGTPIRAASPFAHSTSLPVPAPRGHANSSSSRTTDSSIYHGSASPSPSPSHSQSGQRTASSVPRTPPRRVYHVANASSDSSYGDPPPAYASPVRGETFRREKEVSREGAAPAGSSSPLPLSRPIPSIPIPGTAERSQVSKCSTSVGSSSGQGSSHDGLYDIDPFDASDIPATVEDVLDISAANSSLYFDDNDDAEQQQDNIDLATQRQRLLSPTPPLVIDKRLTRVASLMTQAPRISFHQEGSLEDWTSSLFSAISSDDATASGNDNKRSSMAVKVRRILAAPQESEEDEKAERRLTLRPLSPPAPKVTPSPMSPAPKLPDVSFGRNISIGEHVRKARPPSPEEEEEEAEAEAAETEAREVVSKGTDEPRELLSILSPSLPDISFGLNVSSLGKDLLPSVIPSVTLPSACVSETDPESAPPPPPKVKPKSSLPSLAPPKPSGTVGADGKSPVSPFLRCGPKPLPLPIPPDQIRAQLRPSKSEHGRSSSQAQAANSQLQPQSQPVPSVCLVEPSSSQCSSRRESSSSLAPRSNAGDRDSAVSTVTVTQATIVVVKGQAVRRAVASVIDPDLISPPSTAKRDSFASAFGISRAVSDAQPDQETSYEPEEEESLQVDHQDDDGDGQSLLISGTSSGPPSSPSPTWPAPPPPPAELDKDATPRPVSRFRTTSLQRLSQITGLMGGMIASPRTSHFPHISSETTSPSDSIPLPTPKGSVVPPPPPPKGKGMIAPEARMMVSATDTFGGVDEESEDETAAESPYARSAPSRKSSVAPSLRSVASQSQLWSPITSSPRTGAQIPSATVPHPLLAPLRTFISPIDPSTRFTDLVEIAEGESGSVYAARIPQGPLPSGRGFDTERPIPAETSHVAIKRIVLPPVSSVASLSGEDESLLSIKIASLLHELTLLKNLEHEHILLLDGLYVHTSADVNDGEDDNSAEHSSASTAVALDTSLWIRMELMERSLADVIALVAEGLALQERMVGRFISDVLVGLDYLQKQHIAHRDVRSDNLLLNAAGVVKIADFSNAIRVTENATMVTGAVGVIYWQAPEMRAGPYDALKVDVWSVGATVWELAETVPPFSIPASPSSQTTFLPPNSKHLGSQWPPLSHPEHYSKGFHEFLRLCGADAAARPYAEELLNTQFIRNACGRAVIRQVLTQCRSMEEAMVARDSAASQHS